MILGIGDTANDGVYRIYYAGSVIDGEKDTPMYIDIKDDNGRLCAVVDSINHLSIKDDGFCLATMLKYAPYEHSDLNDFCSTFKHAAIVYQRILDYVEKNVVVRSLEVSVDDVVAYKKFLLDSMYTKLIYILSAFRNYRGLVLAKTNLRGDDLISGLNIVPSRKDGKEGRFTDQSEYFEFSYIL